MSTINTNNNIKANVPANQAPDVNTRAEELQNELEDALLEMEQVRAEQEPYLNDEQLMEMDRMEAMMKAEIAALESKDFVNGAHGGEMGPGWDTSFNPDEVEVGWIITEGGTMRKIEDPEDEQAIYNRFRDDVTYTGTVRVESDRIGYKADDDTEKIEAVSIGSDLALIITRNDGSKEAIVLENGSVRRENANEDFKIIANDQGMTIDCSGAHIVGDGRHGLEAGENAGFTIYGGAGNDVLIGSNNNDIIVGRAGDDIIHGLNGVDNIFGDNEYKVPGTDGTGTDDDYIDGGRGHDNIWGGGGIDSGVSDNDYIVDMGGDVVAPNYRPIDPDEWLDFDSNWELYEDEGGMTALRHTGDSAGTIDINNLPLDNAFAERKDNDLIITFTGMDESGDFSQFSFRIDDFFRTRALIDPDGSVLTLNVHGNSQANIIDFHNIDNLENQIINIFGEEGQDAIYGANNALARDGITGANWEESSVSRTQLNNYAELLNEHELWGNFANNLEDSSGEEIEDPYTATVNEQGQIVITRHESAVLDTEDRDNIINLHAPAGYDNAYITQASDGHTYVIFANGQGDYVTVKFADTDLDFRRINIRYGATTREGLESAGPITPIPITFDDDMYTIDGGEGADTIFAPS